jgi:hypothetical protein
MKGDSMNNATDHNQTTLGPSSQTDVHSEDTQPPTPLPDRPPAARFQRAQFQANDETLPPTSDLPLPNQDEIVTPPPLPTPPFETESPPPPRRASNLLRFLVALALIFSLISLALNALLIYALLNVRQTAAAGLDTAVNSLDDLGEGGFHYEYEFNQDFPIKTDIPVRQEMNFPFEGEFPINTTVEVPINAGVLGSFVVEVPIDTSVYVNTQVPISISETFHVSTSVPVSMTIPIDVQADDPVIQGAIDGLRQWLIELRQSFALDLIPALPFGK